MILIHNENHEWNILDFYSPYGTARNRYLGEVEMTNCRFFLQKCRNDTRGSYLNSQTIDGKIGLQNVSLFYFQEEHHEDTDM